MNSPTKNEQEILAKIKPLEDLESRVKLIEDRQDYHEEINATVLNESDEAITQTIDYKVKQYMKTNNTSISPPEKKQKAKLQFNNNIQPKSIIGLIAGAISFMYFSGMIDFWNFQDPGFQTVLWLVAWTIGLIFGVNKPSFVGLGIEIIRTLNDPTLTNEQRIALVKELVMQFINIWADLSVLQNLEKSKQKPT